MASKTLGYILSGLGLLGLIVTYDPVNKILGSIIPTNLLFVGTIISAVLLIIGIFLISRSSNTGKIEEVPIYHGKNVVGFRRIKQ